MLIDLIVTFYQGVQFWDVYNYRHNYIEKYIELIDIISFKM